MFKSRSIALGLACALLAAPAAGAQDLRMPDTRDAAITSSGLETHPMNPPTISTYTSADQPTSAPLDVGDSGTNWTAIALAAGGFALAVLVVALSTAARGRRRVAA